MLPAGGWLVWLVEELMLVMGTREGCGGWRMELGVNGEGI